MLSRGCLFWLFVIALAGALFAATYGYGTAMMRSQETPIIIPQSENKPDPIILAPVHRCQAGDFVYYNSVC